MSLTIEELATRLEAVEKRLQELEDKSPRKKFVKPTLSEVFAHMKKSLPGSTHDFITDQSNLFLSHYESNGWKVGGVPMKSWKHAIAGTWVTNIKNGKYNGKNITGDFSRKPIYSNGNAQRGFGHL